MRATFMSASILLIIVGAMVAPHISAQTNPLIAEKKDDVTAQDGASYMQEAWDQQRACYTAWAELLKEWRGNGGGIKDSIVATREQIVGDKKSRFAQIVRVVWASQKAVRSDPLLPVGAWPVSNEEFLRIFKKSDSSVEGIHPEECQAFSWLDPLLWNEVKNTNQSTGRKLSETPVDMIWDSYYAPLWIDYWLFVRID